MNLFLDNGLGRRKLGETEHSLIVGEALGVGIDLSVELPDPGEMVTARAVVTKGKIPGGAKWAWRADGGVLIASRGEDTVGFRAASDGVLSADLFVKIFDAASAGKTEDLGNGQRTDQSQTQR